MFRRLRPPPSETSAAALARSARDGRSAEHKKEYDDRGRSNERRPAALPKPLGSRPAKLTDRGTSRPVLFILRESIAHKI